MAYRPATRRRCYRSGSHGDAVRERKRKASLSNRLAPGERISSLRRRVDLPCRCQFGAVGIKPLQQRVTRWKITSRINTGSCAQRGFPPKQRCFMPNKQSVDTDIHRAIGRMVGNSLALLLVVLRVVQIFIFRAVLVYSCNRNAS